MIRLGGTRLVLLKDDTVYKIALIRPVRTIVRLVKISFSISSRKRFFDRFGPGIMFAVCNYMFIGLYANRREYNFWKATADVRVAPVKTKRFFGFVIMQERTQDLGKESYLSKEIILTGTRHPRDYGILHGRIVLRDYGESKTVNYLLKTNPNSENSSKYHGLSLEIRDKRTTYTTEETPPQTAVSQ